MGKCSKRTIKNRIRTEDKMRKEAGEVPTNAKTLTNRMINNAKKKQSRNISCIANTCILCYTMSVMRDKWKFSAEKLRVLFTKKHYAEVLFQYLKLLSAFGQIDIAIQYFA